MGGGRWSEAGKVTGVLLQVRDVLETIAGSGQMYQLQVRKFLMSRSAASMLATATHRLQRASRVFCQSKMSVPT